MKTIELFCGTKSFSKVMNKYGHRTFTIDNNPQFNPDLCKDILNIYDISGYQIVWAFSVASIGKNWNKDGTPKSKDANLGISLLGHTIGLISKSDCNFWFIENPRGMMRKIIDPIFERRGIKDYRRVTVSYCQYGDSRMKPTDIWTNLKGWDGKLCKNGDSCHVSAPRGSKTGTQGIKGSIDRGRIPEELFEEILKHISK